MIPALFSVGRNFWHKVEHLAVARTGIAIVESRERKKNSRGDYKKVICDRDAYFGGRRALAENLEWT